MDDIYLDHILDHAENPRRKGKLEAPTHSGEYTNTSCGDTVTIDALVVDNRIQELRWRGEGCVVSQAAASLLAETAEGLFVDEIMSWTDEVALEKLSLPDVSYARRKCALAFFHGLQSILAP